MKLDPNEPIVGLRPAMLKALLRRDVFDTPTAMKMLSLDEPRATSTLVTLQNEGWIEFKSTRDFVDWWCTGSRGRRLVATRLLKRIPAAEAYRIVDALIAEARAVNADPAKSRRVTSIRIFGSVLTARESEDVGDVDVVVDVRRRNLAKPDLEGLEREEKRDMPQSLSFIAELYWPERRIKRHLARVSRWLSFHEASDIDDLGAPYRVAYAFDLDAEREVEQDLVIRRSIPVEGADRDDEAGQGNATHGASKVWQGPQPWPVAPNRKVSVRLEEEHGRLAQHMWQNGANLSSIAKKVWATKSQVEAYLAGRGNMLTVVPVAVDGSFKRTILRALPASRSYATSVGLHLRSGRDSLIDIDLQDGRTGREIASLRWCGGRHIIHHAQGSLIPELERVLRACKDWLTHMRSRTKGLELELFVSCDPDESADDTPTPWISLSRLAPTLTTTLDQVWSHPRKPYEEWDRVLKVTLSEPIKVTFLEGSSRKTVIAEQSAKSVLEFARTLLVSHKGVLGDGSIWIAGVRGSALITSR